MKLVIVESPSKAKTVEKYLGKGYKVLASVGHIRDLPKQEKQAIDIENGYKPYYVLDDKKLPLVKDLRKEVKKADSVLLATDPDREGESIAWHLQEVLEIPNAKRIVFYEITESAIKEAIEKPRDIDEKLKVAQEARRVLDRLFGYGLSGLIWKKLRYGLSAGRVQSPALRILVEREKERLAFKPTSYWILSADLKYKKDKFIAICEETFYDEDEVNKFKKFLEKGKWNVTDITKKLKKRNPYAPFITSTLQQAANSCFGYSPSYAMSIAQKLYEKGLITYMRTDSTRLSMEAHKQIEKFIINKYGKENYKFVEYKTKKKTAQEAHEAIRPTKVATESVLDPRENNIYQLIRNRTIASQMKEATFESTTIFCNVPDSKYRFKVQGSIIIDKGWMLVGEFSDNKTIILPNVKKGDSLDCKEVILENKETTPPNRYSEAGLVKEMEERGIGRPSTYASIIKVLINRIYVIKEGKVLIPTDTGIAVNTFLEKHFNKYITDKFTSDLEEELDEIAEGSKKYVDVLDSFYKPFKKDVDSKENVEKFTIIGKVPDDIRCPTCKANMVYRLSKNGTFMSCSKFPDCNGARTNEGKEIEPPKETGKKCPKCKNELVLREGRFGKFISCSNYPKCKHIEDDPEEKKKAMTNVSCPKCKKGEIMKRMGKFGEFYSCDQYPDCRFIIKSKPTGKNCKVCNSLMMEGTKTIPERCSDKTCSNNRPEKKK